MVVYFQKKTESPLRQHNTTREAGGRHNLHVKIVDSDGIESMLRDVAVFCRFPGTILASPILGEAFASETQLPSPRLPPEP